MEILPIACLCLCTLITGRAVFGDHAPIGFMDVFKSSNAKYKWVQKIKQCSQVTNGLSWLPKTTDHPASRASLHSSTAVWPLHLGIGPLSTSHQQCLERISCESSYKSVWRLMENINCFLLYPVSCCYFCLCDFASVTGPFGETS